MAVGLGAGGIWHWVPIGNQGPQVSAGISVAIAYVGVGGNGVTVGATEVLNAWAIWTSAAEAVRSNAGPEETGALLGGDIETASIGGRIHNERARTPTLAAITNTIRNSRITAHVGMAGLGGGWGDGGSMHGDPQVKLGRISLFYS